MADVTEVIKRLIVEAQTRGLDKAAADFEKFGTAAKQAATTSENALASTGKSFERLAGSIDPARKQLQLLAKDLATLESGRGRAGVSDEYINGLKQARIETANLAIEATKTNAAIGAQANGMAKLGPAVGLARHEMINFGRQAQDVFVQLASGQSAIMTLVQQGPQIADVFTSSQGSLKGFAEQVGSAAARFGPWIVAIGAVGTALYQLNRQLEQTKEAQQALGGGRGRFLQAAPEDIERAAERTRQPGVSLSEAREGILAGVRAGGPDLQSIEQANALSQRYAATIKSDLAPAQKQLADLIGDRTTASYVTVSRSLRAYNADVEENIRALQGQGRFAEAAKAALAGIDKALLDSKNSTSAMAREWAEFWTIMEKGATRSTKAVQDFMKEQPQAERRGSSGAAGRAARREMDERSPETTTSSFSREGLAIAAEMQAQAEAMSRADKMIAKATADEELRQTNIANAIKKATEAQNDQIAVMNALTVAQRAAAVETQTYNQLLDQGVAKEEARGKAALASQMVIAQAANEMTRALRDQQNQLAAVRQQRGAVAGGAGETELAVLNAKLQEENQLRTAGIDIKSREAQERIANAGTIARETATLQDQLAARRVLQQGAVQAAGLQADIETMGEEQSARTEAIETAKLQVQVEQLLADGKVKEAAATQEVGMQIIGLTRARDEEVAAMNRKIARMQAEEEGYRRLSQAAASAEAGFAKASTFSTPWAKPTQQATITGPKDTDAVLWGGGGFKSTVKFVPRKKTAEEMQQEQEKREGGQQQQSDLARQTLGTAISSANAALGKQIEALRNATERSTDAQNKRTELEGKLKEQEDKRQSRIQNYLAAGPSPFEQNADIFYDPKKRMAFAETIAGGIDEQLKVQIEAAKAEADAADTAQKQAEAQIAKLQDQQQALQDQSELLSAGVDLSKAEVDGINALIQEIQSGLPENIAAQFARILGAQMGQANKQAADIQKSTGVGGGSYSTQVLNQTAGTSGGSTSPFGSYSASAFDPYNTTRRLGGSIGGFASGGEFMVPGTYGAGDRPFVMGLAGQEKVTIQTPGQQRSGGSRGTSIENLIVQMPPMTDPIVYLNKRSRPALGRAIRNTARGMN